MANVAAAINSFLIDLDVDKLNQGLEEALNESPRDFIDAFNAIFSRISPQNISVVMALLTGLITLAGKLIELFKKAPAIPPATDPSATKALTPDEITAMVSGLLSLSIQIAAKFTATGAADATTESFVQRLQQAAIDYFPDWQKNW